jgi:hypothetical protein
METVATNVYQLAWGWVVLLVEFGGQGLINCAQGSKKKDACE